MLTLILKIVVMVLIFRLVCSFVQIDHNKDKINSAWDSFLGKK